jgi:hypothetical protein
MNITDYLKSKGWVRSGEKNHKWMLPKTFPYEMFTTKSAVLAQEKIDAKQQKVSPSC